MSTQLRLSLKELIEAIKEGVTPNEVADKNSHLNDLRMAVERQRENFEAMEIKEAALEKHVSELESHVAHAEALLEQVGPECHEEDYYGEG